MPEEDAESGMNIGGIYSVVKRRGVGGNDRGIVLLGKTMAGRAVNQRATIDYSMFGSGSTLRLEPLTLPSDALRKRRNCHRHALYFFATFLPPDASDSCLADRRSRRFSQLSSNLETNLFHAVVRLPETRAKSFSVIRGLIGRSYVLFPILRFRLTSLTYSNLIQASLEVLKIISVAWTVLYLIPSPGIITM